MYERWGDFFFMIGSSSAALIGLMFVVITLTAGRDRAEIERGKKLYTSPIVWDLSVILVLSGAAIAPTMTRSFFAAACGGLGILGILRGIRSSVGISRLSNVAAVGFDAFWYGTAPALVYVGLTVGAVGVFRGASWAPTVVAADLMALLLVSIHAEWDLVTFLAPTAGQSGEIKDRQS